MVGKCNAFASKRREAYIIFFKKKITNKMGKQQGL
jgi:hypothetical protein